MFVLGEYFDYDTFVILVSIVGGCAIVSLFLSPELTHDVFRRDDPMKASRASPGTKDLPLLLSAN